MNEKPTRPKARAGGERDAITRELVRNGLESVVDEMALTVVRTAYSGTLRDVMDFSTAFLDPAGEMVAQGLTLPLHLGAFPVAMRSVLDRFGNDMGPGDVFVMNDPYAGGMHLPDVFIIKPVFVDGRLIGFPATVAHQADIGGRAPGGNACDSSEIYAEGLRIGPNRLYHRGRENETLFDMIERNVRVPESVLGDFRAQLAALHVGEGELVRLARRYTPEALLAYSQDLIDQSEQMARRDIAAWPDGTYQFTDYIDDDGITLDSPIEICVKVVISGSQVTVDFDGTSPQVDSAINSTFASSQSATWFSIRTLMDPNIPNNAGIFKTITVRAPEGVIVNPRPPAAVAARALTCFRIVDAVMGAMAEVVPDRVFAASEGGISVVMIAGEKAGKAYLLMDSVGCGWGGRPDKDGIDGITGISLNVSNIPIEIIERDNPIRIEHYGFVPDTGGVGQYRGGLAIERAHRLLDGTAFLQVRSDRRKFQPYPLSGGGPGAPSMTRLVSEDGVELLPTKVTTSFRRDQMVVHRTAGAGGWGDRLLRDPALVDDDVREGKVGRQAARENYGVCFDVAADAVDLEATRTKRAGLRRSRSASRA